MFSLPKASTLSLTRCSGITLSGGQKARVALARAVYARTKYVFLDDPLSAVVSTSSLSPQVNASPGLQDSHTSRFLFERLFSGPLLANRTVVLVTHHVGLVLPACQYLVHMLNGRIEAQGTPEGLRARGLLHDSLGDSSKKIENDGAGPSIEAPTVDTMLQEVKAEAKEVAKVASAAKTPRQLVQDERRETGGVKWSIYNTYLKSSYVRSLKYFIID
jgi:ABC-type multidrug transport system ATPase subunit